MSGEGATAVEEQAAYVWTLRSQARVGSYQHELSSGPWLILLGEEAYLRDMLAAPLSHGGRDGVEP